MVASCHITCRIRGWSKTCQAITKSLWTHTDKLCPRLSTTTPLESQQNGTACLKTDRLQKLLVNIHPFLHLLVSQPSDSWVWGFHSGWKLQQLQLRCSRTSPPRCPGDEGVPDPHPKTARSRDRPNTAAGCQLRVASPSSSAAQEDEGTASQSQCNGARASRQHSGTDPSPTAVSGTIWQCEALHSTAHQLRVGLEGAGPSGDLSQAKPGC